MSVSDTYSNIRRLWRLLLVSLLLIAAMEVGAASHPLSIPGAEKTRVGIYIEDLATGDVVADVNSRELFTPASVMKSVTSATVLSELVAEGRFVTPVQAVGRITDAGMLEGNVVVEVVGDPTIESRHFASNLGFADSIAAGLKRAGIRAVRGNVVIDESRFVDATVPSGWEKADLSYSYGTVMRAACYRGNSSGKSAVADPASVMRREVIHAIGAAGIEVRGEAVTPERDCKSTLYVHTSPRVDEILHSLMVRSDNLMAEGMLRALESGKKRRAAIDHEVALWSERGLSFDGISICDGSGLSRSDRLSPRFVADLYRWMYCNPQTATAYAALFPRAGCEGTMRNFLKDTRLQGRLAMKTGSMTGVQGFGGYLLDDDGRPTHTVVVFVNDFTCSREVLKREIARYLLECLP